MRWEMCIELDREDHAEDPAADGQDGRLPGAARDVGEGRAARRAQHRREGLGEHALDPYRREHPRLGGEDPVAGVAQDPAHPRVDVVGYGGEGRVRDEERDGEREPRGGGEPEAPPPSLRRAWLARHRERAAGPLHRDDGPAGVVAGEGRRHAVLVRVEVDLAVECGLRRAGHVHRDPEPDGERRARSRPRPRATGTRRPRP
jgi:hypothetical protein